MKPQSTHLYLAVVRSLHDAHGLPNPPQPGHKLEQIVRGIERQQFSPTKQKVSLTFDILTKLSPIFNPSGIDETVH